MKNTLTCYAPFSSRSTKAASDYELNQKLVRFALSRGFTYDIIRQCLDVSEEFEDDDF